MPFIKGEDINLGIARETVRGTPETPSIFVAGRTPTGIRQIVEKTTIKETRGTGMASQGAVMVQKRSEGDIEFNVKNGSIGYILLSLLGNISTGTDGSGYNHTFSILTGNPQYPTLTLALSQLGKQDYEYAKCLVSSLEIRTPVDDLVNATANFIGISEDTHTDYTVAFPSTDHYFRHYDVTIKIATTTAGLAAAPALAVKEFSLSIANNGRVNQNIGELNPSDVLALMQEISGSLKIDYEDETHHDIYAAEAYRALQITMVRSDVVISSGVFPKIVVTLPKVSYKDLGMDRPIDDIASQDIEFEAHYDETTASGGTVVVTNEIANYA